MAGSEAVRQQTPLDNIELITEEEYEALKKEESIQ